MSNMSMTNIAIDQIQKKIKSKKQVFSSHSSYSISCENHPEKVKRFLNRLCPNSQQQLIANDLLKI